MTTRDRFFAKVSPEPMTGCWLWTGSISAKGYGRFKLGGRNRLAYAVAHEILVGPIPGDGLVFDHVCNTKCCANPAHLRRVTNAENTRRGRAALPIPTTCRNGHQKTARGHCRACGRNRSARFYARRRAESSTLCA